MTLGFACNSYFEVVLIQLHHSELLTLLFEVIGTACRHCNAAADDRQHCMTWGLQSHQIRLSKTQADR